MEDSFAHGVVVPFFQMKPIIIKSSQDSAQSTELAEYMPKTVPESQIGSVGKNTSRQSQGEIHQKMSQISDFEGFPPWRGSGSPAAPQSDSWQDLVYSRVKFMKNATKPP